MRIQHKDHNRPTLEVDHCFCKVKNLLCKTRLFITRSFHRFGNSSHFIIHQRHNFLPILALILLKLKHASNRLVYCRGLGAAHSALQEKSSLIIFQHTYANLLSSKITQHDKISQKMEISQKSFPAKNLLKQTTYLLLEAKNPSYFNCVRTNETHNRCHRAYAIKQISDSSHQDLSERTLTVNNKAQKRQQAFIQIIFHCHISIFF